MGTREELSITTRGVVPTGCTPKGWDCCTVGSRHLVTCRLNKPEPHAHHDYGYHSRAITSLCLGA